MIPNAIMQAFVLHHQHPESPAHRCRFWDLSLHNSLCQYIKERCISWKNLTNAYCGSRGQRDTWGHKPSKLCNKQRLWSQSYLNSCNSWVIEVVGISFIIIYLVLVQVPWYKSFKNPQNLQRGSEDLGFCMLMWWLVPRGSLIASWWNLVSRKTKMGLEGWNFCLWLPLGKGSEVERG